MYQYLYYTSNHPQKTFKAVIKGECIRYIRTNTSYETYAAMTHCFKKRLLKRNYPIVLIDKTFASLNIATGLDTYNATNPSFKPPPHLSTKYYPHHNIVYSRKLYYMNTETCILCHLDLSLSSTLHFITSWFAHT